MKEATSHLNSKVTELEKDLVNKVDPNTLDLEELRNQNKVLKDLCNQHLVETEHLKESNTQYCKEMGDFHQKYVREEEKLWNFLSIIFPKACKAYNPTPWNNQDKATFIESLETKLISSGCESTACQGKIQEATRIKDEEISTLKKDCSKLEADFAAHFESFQHQLSRHKEIIQQREESIKNLHSKLRSQQEEPSELEHIRCQEENNLSDINNISGEKSESIDSEIIQENKPEHESKTIRSDIEKILLEISNERRIAAEHRKNLNDKIITFRNDSARYMKRKFMRYRGERASQIASFEERIKREIGNMISRSSNEEMRFLESTHRHEKEDIIQQIKKLEDSNQKYIQTMTEDINKVKADNLNLKQQLNEKEKDLSKLEELFNQKLDSVILEVQKKEKEALHQIPSSNTCYHAPSQGSKSTENFNRKHPVSDNYDGNTPNSMKSISLRSSKYSSLTRKTNNEKHADSPKLFINSYRFAIDMEDKILLYDKDPRLRIHLGSKVKLSNKFGCLINNKSYEREI